MKIRKNALLLAGIFAFTLLSCSRGDARGGSSQTGAVDDLSEHYVYSFSMLNWGQIYGTDFNSDDVAQHFQKKFNFEWDTTITTWDDWYQKPVLWITSGDMPDLVFTDFNFNDYKNWADQDLLKRLPDGWKQMYPNLARLQQLSVVAPEVEKRVEGNPATLLNAAFSTLPTSPRIASHYSLFFRKDWAEALGFEIKNQYTLQEFTAMIEKFQAESSSLPGVTRGRTDTWNLSTGGVVNAFVGFQWPNATRFYKDGSGKYVWGPDDPQVLELLKYMKQAIDKGIVSKNFASFRNSEEDSLFASGQAFGMLTHGWIEYVYRYFNQFQEATGLDPFGSLQQATLTDPNGHFSDYEGLNFWACLYFNPKMSDAKFSRLLSILDYIASDEAQDVIRLGFEGKDYTRDGGIITITRAKDASGNFEPISKLYPGAGVYSHITICADEFAAKNPAIPQQYQKYPRTMYDTKQKIGVDTGTVLPYNFDLYFFSGPNFLKFNTDVGGELVRVCMMDGDLTANYNNWLKDMRPVVDPVLAELNAAFGK
jgi:putative aldouronate transport system substrate-binding protein